MELALLLPIVLIVILTVVQAGLLGRDVVLVTHAAREAARAAAVDPTPGAARRAALASSSLRGERLAVSVRGGTGTSDRVRVALTYRVRLQVPIVGSLLGDRTVHASATMRLEDR
ncbi:MAG: TadE/TadG family type IV pilus assembly protein [Microthrixaceae bacterium]